MSIRMTSPAPRGTLYEHDGGRYRAPRLLRNVMISSHVTQAISELGGVEAQNPLIQNVNFFTSGVVIAAFALGLYRNLYGAARSALGTALVGGFGLVAVAHAFLRCDAGCEFVSTVGTLHNVTGLAGFVSVITGVFLISRIFAACLPAQFFFGSGSHSGTGCDSAGRTASASGDVARAVVVVGQCGITIASRASGTAAHDRPQWLYLADGTNHEVWILRTGRRVQTFDFQPSGVE